MNSAAVPTLAAIAIQSALGLGVFQANPRRKSNQCFLLLSAVIACWLGSLYFTFIVHESRAGRVLHSASFGRGSVDSRCLQSPSAFDSLSRKALGPALPDVPDVAGGVACW